VPTNKNQHTVPQFYLRRWAQNGHVWTYEPATGRTFNSDTRNVASESWFYNLPAAALAPGEPADVVDQTVNAAAEAEFKQALDTLLYTLNNKGRFNQKVKLALARGIAHQYIRTRAYRELLRRENDYMKGLIQSGKIPEDRIIRVETGFDDKDQVWGHAQSLRYEAREHEMADALLSNGWMIGSNKSAQPYYTSDNPVVMHNHLPEPFVRQISFDAPGIEIALPLTPKFILIIFNLFAPVQKELAYFNNRVRPHTEENVLFYNDLQVMQCHRHIYSSQSSFRMADDLCNARPHLRDPDRERFQLILDTEALGL
jgi:hypothetical protein